MLQRLISLLLLSFILTGCGSVQFDDVHMAKGDVPVANKLTAEQKQSMSELTVALQEMDPSISPQEATLVAHDSIVYSMVLANKYELSWPPLWHNVLVNSKKRPRGLCYHWQRDLISHFKKKNLKTMDLLEGVAYEKDYWREHNTLVVTAKGKPFDSGMVLDPWRDSGVLAWSRVQEDKYPWKLRVWKKTKKKAVATTDGKSQGTTKDTATAN